MIPKIIHYCWFGGNPLPDYAVKYIESWKKFFPAYEIKEWNENNYNVHKIPYTSEAYDAKKYAFVSDYARFDILYEFGGIYFDVDVEVIKPFDKILYDTGFIGTERCGAIASGLEIGCNAGLGIGCNANLGIVKEILEHYEKEHFLCNNGVHLYNLKTVVKHVTEILAKKGFDIKKHEIQRIADFTIYPPEYFAPENYTTFITNITDKSVSIHHYWIGKEKDLIKWTSSDGVKNQYLRKRLFGLLGDNIISLTISRGITSLFLLKNFFLRIFNKGIVFTLKYYYNKLQLLFAERK